MDRRTQQRKRGDEAEDAVVALLTAGGYSIRHRNFHCRYGEVDVVAEKGELLCFVEVRMRSSNLFGDPAMTVSRAKQGKIVQTAFLYLSQFGVRDRMIRFDVVSVLGRGPKAHLEHIPSAFDAGM